MTKIPKSPCEEWAGSRNNQGYGTFYRPGDDSTVGRTVLAHREAYERHYGAIPSGMVVCHVCDNPPCVKPEHLYLGSHLQNVRDCIAKGRAKRGGRNLTKAEREWRREIALSDPRPANELVKELGVTQHTICRWRRDAGQGRNHDLATRMKAAADPRDAWEVADDYGVWPQTIYYWRQLARSQS